MSIVFHDLIEIAVRSVEALAVVIMMVCIAIGTVRWLWSNRSDPQASYARYRVNLAKTLLIGLELLVAADIIRTVLLELTMDNIAALGALVLVRTFLGWALTVETEGHWPWQGGAKIDA